jgi:ribosome biogenesis GTPase
MSKWRDEDDVRQRPSRGNNPRRSKDQPAHEDAIDAFVVTVDRGRITCAPVSDHSRRITAVKARNLGRKGVVVGDRVGIVGDVSGDVGSLARIVRRDERRSTLRRTADDTDTQERVLVANADRLAIVVAAANPEPRTGLIDRCLIAAYAEHMDATLIVTKTDLASPTSLMDYYRPLGVDIYTSTRGEVTPELRALMSSGTTVLVGHSGVGKSTLLNGLVPHADRRTGDVNVITGRGRHTSTNAESWPLGDEGWVIDTPGIRSFGLAHVTPDSIIKAFPTLTEAADECPRGCTHDESECALNLAVETGVMNAALVESVRRLMRGIRAGLPG